MPVNIVPIPMLPIAPMVPILVGEYIVPVGTPKPTGTPMPVLVDGKYARPAGVIGVVNEKVCASGALPLSTVSFPNIVARSDC